MAIDPKSLTAALRASSMRTRVIAGACALVLVIGGVAASMIASRPHFVLLYSGLDDHARAGVEKALAGAAVRYTVSQPPGPYVVYVDESQRYEAQNQVGLSGALTQMPHGIESGTGGAASIFLSSAERSQGMLKREWEEMEAQLRTLEFVSGATVTTSIPDASPIREKKPMTVSVTLALKDPNGVTAEQSANVATLVRFRFGVPAENVVITDQNGRTLFDPASSGDSTDNPATLTEYAGNYDQLLTAKINAQLAMAYGARKAIVALTSEWDHDQRTIVAEIVDPKGTLLSEEKIDSRTPIDMPASGGVAGASSNLATNGAFGIGGAPGATPVAKDNPEDHFSTTNELHKTYEASRTKTQTVHSAPTLRRLSVSVVLDESLAAQKDAITALVRAGVGFDETRKDVISVSTVAIVVPDAAADADAAKPPAPAEKLSPATERLIQRGLEIAATITFLFVLFRALRGAKSKTGDNADAAPDADSAFENALGHDPELVARVKIEELVRSDPRRLGEILSRWAEEEKVEAK